MKKNTFLGIALCFAMHFLCAQTYTWNPEFFNEDENVTLTVSNFDPNGAWGVPDIYLWAWHFDSQGTQINNPTATGTNFGNSPETAKFTNNGDGTYTFDFGRPQDFFDNTGITRIGYLIKSKDGTEQGPDLFQNVGIITVNITDPATSFVLLDSGDNLAITATISFQGSITEMGTFEVYLNNTLVDSGTCGTDDCVAQIQNITTGGEVRFVGSPPGSTETGEATFQVSLVPTVVIEALPAGLEDGINYGTNNTSATLVLSAPGKEFVQIAGSWNNYNPISTDVMKRDPGSGKYWLEITGLTPGNIETYQYWVFDTNPVAGSPELVKTADPFSTLVLSPFDDPFISENTYPNLPEYPEGQEREVTVLQTGQTPYDWQVPNFQKPKQEDLIIYEVLVRDFDADRNYQDLIDRIDYFRNLNINAIHLMPVMEFEGNESWGYNTSFHMALDKFYGTEDKLKELIDVCHQNGIAIILDVVLNHAFGRNPMVRMWMDDPDGDGWGGPASDSPYFNQLPTHSFSVGNDFNHQQPLVQEYTRRVIKHWIEDFNIDGFRWDLTKGFTQNCGNGTQDGDFNCTQNNQDDRVDVLKEYADYSWSLDASHYVIFEHLGSDFEERKWANYLDNGRPGIMMWGKMTSEYNELTMGQTGNKSIFRMGHDSRGFTEPRLLGYPESHDEERLMYNNLINGNTSNTNHNVRDLNVALSRMSALGAVSTMIPGPKMIWHFGDLGMDNSIFTCNNGTVNLPGGSDGDCKLDTKPQPQWTENWITDALRRSIYDDWSRLHALKINEPVFEGDYEITSGSSNFTPRIDIFDTSIPTSELSNVVVLSNFDVNSANIMPNFPTGVSTIWYDLMDPTGATTVGTTTPFINIPAGQFRIFGNQPAQALSIDDETFTTFTLYPNPAQTRFNVSLAVSNLEIYDIAGKLVKSFEGNFTTTDSFDISTLNTGMYIVKVENNNNETITTKLVKL